MIRQYINSSSIAFWALVCPILVAHSDGYEPKIGQDYIVAPVEGKKVDGSVSNEAFDDIGDDYENSFKQKITNNQTSDITSISTDVNRVTCILEPDEIVEVASPVIGIVESISAKKGDYISKGQVIANLKMDLEMINVDLYKARLEFSNRSYSRLQEVYDKNFVSKNEYEQAKIERDIATYELAREIELLKMKTIKSPIAGFLIEKYFSPGEYVDSDSLVKIAKINPLNVEVTLPIAMLGELETGTQAEIYPEGPIKGPLIATVDIVEKVVDPASGTFGVRLKLPNPDHAIPSGVKCRIKWD